MIFKNETIARYVLENGIDYRHVSNSLAEAIANDLTEIYGEPFNKNTVKLALSKLRRGKIRIKKPHDPKTPHPPPPQPTTAQTPPPTQIQTPPQTKPQNPTVQFIINKRSDGTATMQCPNCGAIQHDVELPVVEKEIRRIPLGYIKAPRTPQDFVSLLETTIDGVPIWQIPEYADAILDWWAARWLWLIGARNKLGAPNTER